MFLVRGLDVLHRVAYTHSMMSETPTTHHQEARMTHTTTNTHDHLNPCMMFQNTDTALLVEVLSGAVSCTLLIRIELANRGLNQNGKWVGFPEAQRLLRVAR